MSLLGRMEKAYSKGKKNLGDRIKSKLAKREEKASNKKTGVERRTERQEARKLNRKEKEADEKAQGFKKIERVKAKKKEVGVIGSAGIARKVEKLKGRMER